MLIKKMELNLDFLQNQVTFTPITPILTKGRRFLQSLKEGDIIYGARETVTVVRGVAHPNRTRWVCLIKRPDQKRPITLRECFECESCIEIKWSHNEGFKCIDIDTLRVVSVDNQV
jgi:hypothetical protein